MAEEQVGTEQAASTAETAVSTAPAMETAKPTDTSVVTSETAETHPLEPGGDRFKEVWARAKSAEAERDKWKEQAIRHEERAKVLAEKAPKPAEQEFTWPQLQQMIDDGKVTLAQALEYRETKVAQRVTADAEARVRATQSATQKQAFVEQELRRYAEAIPSLSNLTSEERQRAEREFQFVLSVDGLDSAESLSPSDRRRYELKALRAAFGSVETATASRATDRETRANRETYMETATGGGGTATATKGKDPLKGITAREREHYERMIRKGRYSDPKYSDPWDEVRAELAFEPPRRRR